MYLHLLTASRRKIISELKEYFGLHPIYNKLEIQDKYAYEERPQFGMVVQSVNASKIQLAADNYMGTIVSHVGLAKEQYKPSRAIEWVVEDTPNIGNLVSEGMYYIEVVEVGEQFKVEVDQILDIAEPLVEDADGSETTLNLEYEPLPNTLELHTTDPVIWKIEGTHFIVSGKQITLLEPLSDHDDLIAEYRSHTSTAGPYEIIPNTSNNEIIPGVVLAFGNQLVLNDRQIVMVKKERENMAYEYGGKWEITMTIDVVARDPIQRDEILDEAIKCLWVYKKEYLDLIGFFIQDVSPSGMSEEDYDPNSGDMYYRGSVDLTVLTDWRMAVPLFKTVKDIGYGDMFVLPDEEASKLNFSVKMVRPGDPNFISADGKEYFSKNFEYIR